MASAQEREQIDPSTGKPRSTRTATRQAPRSSSRWCRTPSWP